MADLLSFTQNLIAYRCSIFSCIENVTRLYNMTIHKQQERTTDSTSPVETSVDMQSRSLPTCRYTSTMCYISNSYIGKSVHLLLGQNSYPTLSLFNPIHKFTPISLGLTFTHSQPQVCIQRLHSFRAGNPL